MRAADYNTLDAKILEAIGGYGPIGFQHLLHFCEAEGNRLASLETTKNPLRPKDGWRIVDRRLQALRKSRRISYQRKSAGKQEGWVLVKGGAA